MTTLADDGRTQVDKTSRTVRTWLCVVRVEIYHTLCTVDAVLAEPNPREGRGEGRRLNATSLAWTVVIIVQFPLCGFYNLFFSFFLFCFYRHGHGGVGQPAVLRES